MSVVRLANLVELKQWLGVADCTVDRALDGMIVMASAVVAGRVRQPVLSANVEEHLQGYGCDVLALDVHPATAVVSIHEMACAGEADTLVDPAEYEATSKLIGDRYYVRRIDGDWGISAVYRVTLTVGYQEVPDEIATATLMLAAEIAGKSRVAAIGKGRLGLTEQVEPVAGASVPAGATEIPMGKVRFECEALIEELLEPFKRKGRYF